LSLQAVLYHAGGDDRAIDLGAGETCDSTVIASSGSTSTIANNFFVVIGAMIAFSLSILGVARLRHWL
jgi:hypothetical protein